MVKQSIVVVIMIIQQAVPTCPATESFGSADHMFQLRLFATSPCPSSSCPCCTNQLALFTAVASHSSTPHTSTSPAVHMHRLPHHHHRHHLIVPIQPPGAYAKLRLCVASIRIFGPCHHVPNALSRGTVVVWLCHPNPIRPKCCMMNTIDALWVAEPPEYHSHT
jgi:hypothetical protein